MSPPILIKANQMVDMALGAGDYNTINMSVLHSLLHVIVKRLQMEDTKIEFRGQNHDVYESMVGDLPAEKYVDVKEYEVECFEDCETRVEVMAPERVNKRIISVIRCGCDRPKMTPPGFPLRALELMELFKPVDPDAPSSKPPSIHNLVAQALPNNEQLLHEVDDGSNILKMWKLLNLTQRVEAIEISLKKLAEVVQVVHDKATELINLIIKCNIRETAKLVRTVDCNLREEVQKTTLLQIAVREIQRKITEVIDTLPAKLEDLWNSKGMHDFDIAQLEERLKYLDDSKVDISAFEDVNSCVQRIYSFEEDFLKTMLEVQKMLDAKFDNCHVPDLKQFIEKYLTAFRDQLDYLTSQICDNTTAGATYKVLRNLNCISCRKFVGQRDEELRPPLAMMPKSIGQKVKKYKPIRHCGGSHTLIGPDEKFAQTSNFNEDYGPPPPSSPITYIRGDDGTIFLGDRPKVFKCCGVCAQCSYEPSSTKRN